MDQQLVFDVISDATRRRILALLTAESELCVCELMAALDEIQPKISRHLSVMREAELVNARRKGTRVFYRLASPLPRWLHELLETLRAAALPDFNADRTRLKKMPGRPVHIDA